MHVFNRILLHRIRIMRNPMRYVASLVIGAWLVVATRSVAAQTIDTRGPNARGVVTTPAFGQTFTVPVGATGMESFSFFFATNAAEVTSPVTTFYAYLVAWNGTGPQGPMLYQSALRNAGPCCTIVQETFTTSGLSVSAGSTYLAFIAPTAGSLVHTQAALNFDFLDTYAGGSAAFAHSCGGSVAACSWTLVPTRDANFIATFSSTGTTPVPVPEPAPIGLLAMGILGLFGLGMRHRRRSLW
jgi:hypothetical protein